MYAKSPAEIGAKFERIVERRIKLNFLKSGIQLHSQVRYPFGIPDFWFPIPRGMKINQTRITRTKIVVIECKTSLGRLETKHAIRQLARYRTGLSKHLEIPIFSIRGILATTYNPNNDNAEYPTLAECIVSKSVYPIWLVTTELRKQNTGIQFENKPTTKRG